jgi:hypothetical protein
MTRSTNLSRRRFLRGTGAAISLPLMDAMANAKTASQSPSTIRRAAFFYVPNGVVQSTWRPPETGHDFELSQTLEPLESVRNQISVYSNLDRIKVAGTDGHAQASTCWLSSAAPDELSPAGYPLKRTIDQLIADQTAKHTPFRSLELSCNPYQDNRESVYFDNISWYGHGHVAKSMRDPQKVFERLFRIEEHQQQASVLDIVMEDAQSLASELGRSDGRKLEEFMESVRSVERQIQRVQSRQKAINKLQFKEPAIPWVQMRRDEYIQIMGDLMILAFQTDLTRVASLMVAPERWGTPQMVHGLFEKPIVHHSMTHAQGDQNVRFDLAKLDRYHVDQFRVLVEKMATVKEGDSTLLDQSMFIFGSGLSSGKTHVYSDLPIVIAGKAGGILKTNQHVQSKEGTPVANLWLSLIQAMGGSQKKLGDSTGTVSLS